MLGLLFGLGACFRPQPPSGAPCATNGECPSGLSCIANACTAGDAGKVVDAPPPLVDADSSCHCVGATLTCASGNTVCAIGCSMDRCERFTPSNSIDGALVDQVAAQISFSGTVVVNTDTGAISNGYMRAAGSGLNAGIVYVNTGAIGVFVFAQLSVVAGTTVTFNGKASAAFLVGGDAMIAGTIDGSGGGCATGPGCNGPGGGFGSLAPNKPGGCGPGNVGVTSATDNADSGGGGGGGGAAGGSGGATLALPSGTGGAACIAPTLEPLVGGSGGAGGGAGATTPAHGGGGGGALQVTVFGTLAISGTITMAGAGGEGGFSDSGPTSDGGAGAGGGAGGGILLEAGALALLTSSRLAANGGGGGGGAAGPSAGFRGADGGTSAAPAAGGAATFPGTTGGAGGAGTIAAVSAVAAAAADNGGGGGGAVGAIYLRSATLPSPSGLQSPPAGTGLVH